MSQCVSSSYQHTRAVYQYVAGVSSATADAATEAFSKADSTFFEHGDTQILFTLWLSAAHDRRGLAILCGGVTHSQDLDLTIILLGSWAVDRCWAIIPQKQSQSEICSTINIQFLYCTSSSIPAK